jgi:hypothetical protein
MMTTATCNEQHTAMHATELVLFLAFALRAKTWKLGFTTGHSQQPRERSITARHQARLLHEVAQAKRRSLNLSEFVVGWSWHMCVRVRLNEAPIFSRDWLENGEEMHSSSASVYALQTAIN